MKRITFCHIFRSCVYNAEHVPRDIRIRWAMTYDLTNPATVAIVNHGDARDLALCKAVADGARDEFEEWNSVIYGVIAPLLTPCQASAALAGKWNPPVWDGRKLNA